MALVSMRQLLDHAAEHGYGLPAFNVNNLEQVQAVMEAAQEVESAAILQISAGARKYAGEPFLRHLMLAALEMFPGVPLAIHQDHGASWKVCAASIRSGFTSVMMDGSLLEDAKTPAPLEYNVSVTAKVSEVAHAVGVSVEGELGVLGSLESGTLRPGDQGGRARHRHRDQPRRLQVLPQAVGRHPRHGSREGDPCAHPRHASRHAWVLQRAAGVARGDQRIRWPDPADLRRAGGGDPARHQARRSQGEHRYRP